MKVKGSINKKRVQTNSDDTTNPYYTNKALRNVHIRYYNVSNAFTTGKSVGHYMDHNTTQKQQIKWGEKQAYGTNLQVNEQNYLSYAKTYRQENSELK